jgi:hypothetical protein
MGGAPVRFFFSLAIYPICCPFEIKYLKGGYDNKNKPTI